MIMTIEDSQEKIEVENQTLPEAEEAKGEAKEEGAPIPRKHVTEIVRRERLDAYQKAKRDIMAEMQEQQAAQAQAAPVPPTVQQALHQIPAQNTGMGGMAQMTPETIQQMIAAEAQKLDQKRRQEDVHTQQQQMAHQVAQQFNSQMANGKAKRSDFDDKVKDLDFNGMSEIVHLAAETGIADEVMYDLADNPQKITHLMILAHTQPKLAQREMQKLAASIKANQQASQQASPRDPLTSITPSTVGTDSGDMSVADFMKIFI